MNEGESKRDREGEKERKRKRARESERHRARERLKERERERERAREDESVSERERVRAKEIDRERERGRERERERKREKGRGRVQGFASGEEEGLAEAVAPPQPSSTHLHFMSTPPPVRVWGLGFMVQGLGGNLGKLLSGQRARVANHHLVAHHLWWFGVWEIHLIECMYQLVLKRQSLRLIVNLLLTITNQNIQLTVLWGSRLSTTNQSIHCVRQRCGGT